MHLAPRDLDKLQLHQAGYLAQKRLWRGLQLNYPEAVALIAAQILEFIRDGESVPTLMNKGKQLLGMREVLPGVADLIEEVQIEGTFLDGTKLVTVHNPICTEFGDLALALYGSGLDFTLSPFHKDLKGGNNNVTAGIGVTEPENSVPGSVAVGNGEVEINAGLETIELEVTNMGDRPVQVGSHYPFFEVNPALRFDREKAFAFRLDIPSGTAVRFEPGESKSVRLVALGGAKKIWGGNGFVMGEATSSRLQEALSKAQNAGAELGAKS